VITPSDALRRDLDQRGIPGRYAVWLGLGAAAPPRVAGLTLSPVCVLL